MTWKVHIAMGVVALTLGALGCGGSDAKPGRDDQEQGATQPKTTKATDGRELALPQPLLPRCGVETFAAPAISRAPAGGWRLEYRYPERAPRRPAAGQTTVVRLTESPPTTAPTRYPGSRTLRVRGQKVDLTQREGVIVAQWTSKRARYSALANGDTPAVVLKIAGCTP